MHASSKLEASTPQNAVDFALPLPPLLFLGFLLLCQLFTMTLMCDTFRHTTGKIGWPKWVASELQDFVARVRDKSQWQEQERDQDSNNANNKMALACLGVKTQSKQKPDWDWARMSQSARIDIDTELKKEGKFTAK